MTNSAQSPAAAGKIPGLSDRISAWFRHSETIALAWITGLLGGAPVIVAEIANALGEPALKAELDKIITEYPQVAHWYPLAVAGLTYWARTRRGSKDPV